MTSVLAGKNEHGENVLVYFIDGNKVTETYQKDSDWIRVTIEHQDGTVEETYKR